MKRSPSNSGFSLVEVTMAMGVAVFCFLVLIALLPVGINADKNMVNQTVATGLMASVVDDLRNTPAPTQATDPVYGAVAINSPRFQIPIPRAAAGTTKSVTLFLGDDGSLSGAINVNANPTATPTPRYRVQVDMYPPGTGASAKTPIGLGPTRVRILVTWPALADSTATTLITAGPKNFSGSVETVIFLNRNWMDK